jgi:hypothetical protein
MANKLNVITSSNNLQLVTTPRRAILLIGSIVLFLFVFIRFLFVSADYSQIELRIMAHLSNDKNMLEAFNSGHDIHTATAAKINKIPLEEVTSDMRRKAKTANFGIIYGISTFGLADRLTIPRAEAKELIDGYFATYPDVKRYMDESKNSQFWYYLRHFHFWTCRQTCHTTS